MKDNKVEFTKKDIKPLKRITIVYVIKDEVAKTFNVRNINSDDFGASSVMQNIIEHCEGNMTGMLEYELCNLFNTPEFEIVKVLYFTNSYNHDMKEINKVKDYFINSYLSESVYSLDLALGKTAQSILKNINKENYNMFISNCNYIEYKKQERDAYEYKYNTEINNIVSEFEKKREELNDKIDKLIIYKKKIEDNIKADVVQAKKKISKEIVSLTKEKKDLEAKVTILKNEVDELCEIVDSKNNLTDAVLGKLYRKIQHDTGESSYSKIIEACNYYKNHLTKS